MNSKNEIPNRVKELLTREAPGEVGDLERVWQLASDPSARLGDSDVDNAVHRFERVLRGEQTSTPKASLYFLNRTWKIAASFIILAIAGYLYGMGEVVHEVPEGATATISLMDGSSVMLNGGSTLIHARRLWGKERKVRLDGEAYFDVNSGNRPFVVTTENARIQVLGTEFLVDTWAVDTVATMLKVTEGRVSIASLEDVSFAAAVTAGQQSTVVGTNNPPSDPASFNADLATLWLEGGIASMGQSLLSLMERLERRFGVTITVDDTLQAQRLTWIQPQLVNAQDALHDICEIAGCVVEATENGFKVSSVR